MKENYQKLIGFAGAGLSAGYLLIYMIQCAVLSSFSVIMLLDVVAVLAIAAACILSTTGMKQAKLIFIAGLGIMTVYDVINAISSMTYSIEYISYYYTEMEMIVYVIGVLVGLAIGLVPTIVLIGATFIKNKIIGYVAVGLQALAFILSLFSTVPGLIQLVGIFAGLLNIVVSGLYMLMVVVAWYSVAGKEVIVFGGKKVTPGFNPAPQGFNPNAQPGYNPAPQSFNPNAQPGYKPAAQSFNPNAQPGYKPAPQGFNPNAQPGYNPAPQSSPVYDIPEYNPVKTNTGDNQNS